MIAFVQSHDVSILGRDPTMFLIILTGMPCSGKTQLATILGKELELKHGFPTIVVNPDKIRDMIPALMNRFDPERESFVNSLALNLIEEGLRKKNVVVSDDMNYYESARHRLVQIAKKHKSKYIIVYLTVSLEIAKARNAARTSPIPERLISEIGQIFDRPGAKYKWDRPSSVIDSEKISSEDAAKLVLKSVLSKIGEKYENTEQSITELAVQPGRETSQLSHFRHALDESTRSILNELFSSGRLDRRLSKAVSGMRREFVNEASRSSITIEQAEIAFRRRVSELSSKYRH
jgi:tRNA uridine 5-carbamoylmethylation protein Kti12